MSEIRALYQEMILDHGRNPRNYKTVEGFTHKIEGFNPLCGDHLTLFLKVEDGVVNDVGFSGAGCAISMASASLMSQAVMGKPVSEVEGLASNFLSAVTEKDSDTDSSELGKLQVLTGVKEYPSRVKCATLAWRALQGVLEGGQTSISTE